MKTGMTKVFGTAAVLLLTGGVAGPFSAPAWAQNDQAMAAEDSAIAIVAETLHTMDGPAIENGIVMVRNGKIAAIGRDVKIPAGTKILNVPVLMPGLVDACSSSGVAGGNAEQTSEITPELEVIHSIDWTSRDFDRAVETGTTTLHILPGSDNVFAGGSCVVKVAGDGPERIVAEHQGSVLSVCSDPVSGNNSRSRPDSIYIRQPTNRMGVVWIIRNKLHGAAASHNEDSAEPSTAATVALKKILSGKEAVFTISRTSYDIETVARLNAELGFKSTIVSGEEAWKSIDLLKETGMPVIFTGMTTGSVTGNERSELRWNTPGQLEQAGIVWCLAGDRLLDQARFAVRFGASEEAALAAITTTPATLLGLSSRIGSLRVGMDADVIALDGAPLEFTTGRLWTMVDGVPLDAPEENSPVASDPEINP